MNELVLKGEHSKIKNSSCWLYAIFLTKKHWSVIGEIAGNLGVMQSGKSLGNGEYLVSENMLKFGQFNMTESTRNVWNSRKWSIAIKNQFGNGPKFGCIRNVL